MSCLRWERGREIDMGREKGKQLIYLLNILLLSLGTMETRTCIHTIFDNWLRLRFRPKLVADYKCRLIQHIASHGKTVNVDSLIDAKKAIGYL